MMTWRALILVSVLATLLVAAASAAENATGRHYDQRRALHEEGYSNVLSNTSKISEEGSVIVQRGVFWNALIQESTRRLGEPAPLGVQKVCTGMLFEANKVLTLGACCDFGDEDPLTKWIKVIIGAHQLQGQVLDTGLCIQAGEWRITQFMCVIRLQESVPGLPQLAPFGNDLAPVANDSAGLFIGWGAQSTTPTSTMQLKSVSVKTRPCSEFVERIDQQWIDYKWGDEQPIFICTDRSQNTGGACPGDEGGPLIINAQVRGMFVRSLPMNGNMRPFRCNPSSYVDIFLDIVQPRPMEFIRSENEEYAEQVFTFP